jgi:hypothetical protein
MERVLKNPAFAKGDGTDSTQEPEYPQYCKCGTEFPVAAHVHYFRRIAVNSASSDLESQPSLTEKKQYDDCIVESMRVFYVRKNGVG